MAAHRPVCPWRPPTKLSAGAQDSGKLTWPEFVIRKTRLQKVYTIRNINKNSMESSPCLCPRPQCGLAVWLVPAGPSPGRLPSTVCISGHLSVGHDADDGIFLPASDAWAKRFPAGGEAPKGEPRAGPEAWNAPRGGPRRAPFPW